MHTRCASLSVVLLVAVVALWQGPVVGVGATSVKSASAPPATSKFFLQEPLIAGVQALINPVIIKSLQHVAVPNVTESKIGIVLTLSDMYLCNFTVQSESVKFLPPNSIGLTISNLGGAAVMNWDYKDGLIHLHGDAVDTFSETTVSVVISGGGKDGHLTLDISSVDVSIGKLDVTIHGTAGKFIQLIEDMINGLLKDIVEDVIEKEFKSEIDKLLDGILPQIPTSFPLFSFAEVYIGLIPSNPHGLFGKSYSNNHFSGDSSAVGYTDFSHISIDNYKSFDVQGFYKPPASANYSFQLHYSQRGRVDVNGLSAGSLEMHNPGMCWPEHYTHQTTYTPMEKGREYPIRLRYQSGCFGGWVELHVCVNGGACNPLNPLDVAANTGADSPVAVYDTPPGYIDLSSALSVRPLGASSCGCPFTTTQLPNTPLRANNSVGMYLGDYVVNSALYTVWRSGFMSWRRLNDPNITTTTLAFFIPSIAKKYPDAPVYVNVTVGDDSALYPSIDISPSAGVSLTLPLFANLSVLVNKTVMVEGVLDMAVNVSGALTLGTRGENITANISSLTVHIGVIGNATFNVSTLNSLINVILKSGVLPLINKKLNVGVQLPSLYGYTLTDIAMDYNAHYAGFGFSIGRVSPSVPDFTVHSLRDATPLRKASAALATYFSTVKAELAHGVASVMRHFQL